MRVGSYMNGQLKKGNNKNLINNWQRWKKGIEKKMMAKGLQTKFGKINLVLNLDENDSKENVTDYISIKF